MAILENNWMNLLVIAGFIFIHLSSKYFLLEKLNIHFMMSFAAGVGVSYAIIHLLPQLAYSQSVLIDQFGWDSGVRHTHSIYAIVLLGLVASHVVYKLDERNFSIVEKKDLASAELAYFWSDISFYMAYNLMIGYLVIANTFSEHFYIATYFVAFGLHFLMNDWTLSHDHGKLYNNIGRYMLSLSIFAGAVLSLVVQLPYFIVVSIEAFITGALLMNIIKFELPDGNEGSIKSFLIGTICSSVLFLFI
ncbi:hypothetical protein [Enterococcus florum]|uniref:hypothetical protein n=1 Tax=Enterococcus florum TaxID=2480627 RepID=UPI0011BAE198|nr:hypothetical protein [Enterococcus florum]